MAKQTRMTSRGAQAREAQVAQVIVECPGALHTGRVLVIDDLEGHLERALLAHGAQVTRWCRASLGEQAGSSWPEPGPFDAAYLRLPRVKAAYELALHAAAWALSPGSPLWVYGANDEGIKSATTLMASLFRGVVTRDARRHCRVLLGKRAASAPVRAPLQAWAHPVTPGPLASTLAPTSTLAAERPWITYPGVFARGELDEGTAALLMAMERDLRLSDGAQALDFACGGGVIAAWLMARWPSLKLHMSDSDAIALLAASHNAPGASAWLSDAWHGLPQALRFEAILSNPPIHRGKSEDFEALTALIHGAPARLLPDGQLWMVVQRQVPVEPLLARGFASARVVAQDTRFRVWCATR